MNGKRRKSAVSMMMVAGGLVAAVPALGAGATVTCNGKPQNTTQTGNANQGFYCNMAPKADGPADTASTLADHGKAKGFFCNMAPKTNAPASATPQTVGQSKSAAPNTNSP